MILIRMTKHSQSSQNSKVVMSLQNLKKEVKDEVDFSHSDKHQSQIFLQGDSIDGHDQAFSKHSK